MHNSYLTACTLIFHITCVALNVNFMNKLSVIRGCKYNSIMIAAKFEHLYE